MIRSGDVNPEQPKTSGLFAATHWSVVQRAKENSATALDTLFTHYRKPMVVFVMMREHDRGRAEDLVQGFCLHLLKNKKGESQFLANVSQTKGKFRTFLLKSLTNYIKDQYDAEHTLKRGVGIIPDSLNEVSSEDKLLHEPKSSKLSADQEFDRAWVEVILQSALHKLKEECASQGKTNLFEAIEPAMHDDETSLSYREIAKGLATTEGAVKVAAHRIRTRLRELIEIELYQTVSSEAEFKEELNYFISLLSSRAS